MLIFAGFGIGCFINMQRINKIARKYGITSIFSGWLWVKKSEKEKILKYFIYQFALLIGFLALLIIGALLFASKS